MYTQRNAYAFYGDIYEEVAELYNAPDFNKEDKRSNLTAVRVRMGIIAYR